MNIISWSEKLRKEVFQFLKKYEETTMFMLQNLNEMGVVKEIVFPLEAPIKIRIVLPLIVTVQT